MTLALEVMNPKLKTVEDLFFSCREQIALAIPDRMSPEKLIRLALTAIANTPKLLECTPKSLFRCMLFSAEFGLEPGPFGLAYYVPFKNTKLGVTEATFMPGYKGIVRLMRNSNELRNIQANAVYANDEFKYNYGLHPDLWHVPTSNPDRGELTHFYCVISLKDGGHQFTVMAKAEVEAHRDEFSQSYKTAEKYGKDSAWHTDFIAMGCKTVIIKTAKLCPISKDAQNVIALNESSEAGFEQPYTPLSSMLMPPEPEAPSENGEEKKKPAKRKLSTSTKSIVLPGYIREYGNRPVTDPKIPLNVLEEVLVNTEKRLAAGYPENRKEMGVQDQALAEGIKKAIGVIKKMAEIKETTIPAEKPTETANVASLKVVSPIPEKLPTQANDVMTKEQVRKLNNDLRHQATASQITRLKLEECHDLLSQTTEGKTTLDKCYENFYIDHWRHVSEEMEGGLLDVMKDLMRALPRV